MHKLSANAATANTAILVVLIATALSLSSCRQTMTESAIKPAFNESLLRKTWWNSREESTAGRVVFRTDDFPLPPARGRTGMTFAAQGVFTYIGIAPADGPLLFAGTWKWTSPTVIRVSLEGKSFQGATWEPRQYDISIVELSADKLVTLPE